MKTSLLLAALVFWACEPKPAQSTAKPSEAISTAETKRKSLSSKPGAISPEGRTEPVPSKTPLKESRNVDGHSVEIETGSPTRVVVAKRGTSEELFSVVLGASPDLKATEVFGNHWVFHSKLPDCPSYWDGCEREHISYLVDGEREKVIRTEKEKLPKYQLGNRTTVVHGDLWILERRDTTESVSPRTQFVALSVATGKRLWVTEPRYEDVYHSSPRVLVDDKLVYICEADAIIRIYTHDGSLEGSWGTPSCGNMTLSEKKLSLSWDGSRHPNGEAEEEVTATQWRSSPRKINVHGRVTPSEPIGRKTSKGWVAEHYPFSGLVLVGEQAVKPRQDGTFRVSTAARGWVAARPLPAIVPDFPVGTRNLAEPSASNLDAGALEIYFDHH